MDDIMYSLRGEQTRENIWRVNVVPNLGSVVNIPVSPIHLMVKADDKVTCLTAI